MLCEATRRCKNKTREDGMSLTRRDVCAAGAASVLTLGTPRARAADLTPFKIGEAAPANTFLAIWMAIDASFYEAQGLKAEIVHMVGGKDSGPDLSAGKIQAMHIGMRSEERRVGKECRSRWSPYH